MTKVGWTRWSDWFSHCSKVDLSGGLDNARELGRILKRRKVEKQREKWIKVMENKILCPTPVPSESFFFYFSFRSSDPSSFVSFYSRVKQGSLYFDCNPNGTRELAEREKWRRKEKERERDRGQNDRRQEWDRMEGMKKVKWWKRKQIRGSENHHTDWKLRVCLCACTCVSAGSDGLPITLSLCEVELLWLQAREDGCRQEERLVTGDWDKGLCSHECHTNKAQSGYWGSGFWGEPWQKAKKARKKGKNTSILPHLWGKIEEQVCVIQDTVSLPYSW